MTNNYTISIIDDKAIELPSMGGLLTEGQAKSVVILINDLLVDSRILESVKITTETIHLKTGDGDRFVAVIIRPAASFNSVSITFGFVGDTAYDIRGEKPKPKTSRTDCFARKQRRDVFLDAFEAVSSRCIDTDTAKFDASMSKLETALNA